jgi:hypothetical protein
VVQRCLSLHLLRASGTYDGARGGDKWVYKSDVKEAFISLGSAWDSLSAKKGKPQHSDMKQYFDTSGKKFDAKKAVFVAKNCAASNDVDQRGSRLSFWHTGETRWQLESVFDSAHKRR